MSDFVESNCLNMSIRHCGLNGMNSCKSSSDSRAASYGESQLIESGHEESLSISLRKYPVSIPKCLSVSEIADLNAVVDKGNEYSSCSIEALFRSNLAIIAKENGFINLVKS